MPHERSVFRQNLNGVDTGARRPYLAEFMKILVIGGGAREHALAWKLKQSSRIGHIWCLPGNAGINEVAECIPGDLSSVEKLAETALGLRADLTIVGPEQPLVLGISDEFEKRNLPILGPSRDAAQLEGSKAFAKQFMQRHKIPTATSYGTFDSPVDAYTSLCEVDWPVVVKADGLCAGKGVLVTSSPDEATSFIERTMEKREFGEAGRRIIIEEGLRGEELSYIVLTDGTTFLPFAPSRDHKRALDGDLGPNTGGMGAISCDDLLNPEVQKTIKDSIVVPTIRGMASEGRVYRGFLYFGLMLTPAGPKVLEFNCRLGDPETEALVMRMNFDLAEAAEATVSGRLASFQTNWSPAASASVVLASEGYPGKPMIGRAIHGIESISKTHGVAAFHGATMRKDNEYYTSSGRVLTIAASANSLGEARAAVYDAVGRISFDGMHYRRDIGGTALGVARH